MSFVRLAIVAVLALLGVLPGHPSVVAAGGASDRGNVYRAMDALERIAQFLDMHGESVTLDHALGVAIARGEVEGALAALLRVRDHGLGGDERSTVTQRLDSVRTGLDHLLQERAGRYTAPATRRLLQPWLWRVDDDRRSADRRPDPVADDAEQNTKPSEQTVMELRELVGLGSPSEGESGRCIAALLEVPVDDKGCGIPESCIRAETEGVTLGYATTHRLLFHHIASQVGCVLPARHIGTQGVMERLCADILAEAEDIARARFPALLRDLFAEQVAVCGLRGFTAFSRAPWLDRMLSWLQPAGCFGNFTELQAAARPFESLSNNARLDDRLGNECVSHLTGVATAAVAFNLRVLVHRWLQQGDHQGDPSRGYQTP